MTIRIGDRVAVEPGVLVEGSMVLEDGTWRLEEGEPGRPGIAIPAPVNAHTHIADTIARGTPVPEDLATAVAPPDGLKHRLLRETPPERLQEGMVRALRENCSEGTAAVLDFREGGVEGVRLLDGAARAYSRVQVAALGRPVLPDASDIEDVLAHAAGAGVSGVGDAPSAQLELVAQACRKLDKPLAIHWSEGRREDLDAVLGLDPSILVHVVHATAADLARFADEDIGVVLCPRSNHLFGGEAPIQATLDAGLAPALGTDNGWFHPSQVLQEAAWAMEHLDASAWDALAMATWNGHALAKRCGIEVQDHVLLEARPDEGLEDAMLAPRITWSHCWGGTDARL